MPDVADQQRYADELERCRILGMEVPAPYPSPSSVTTGNDARYYAERGRVLAAVGLAKAVAFLREEALAALTGRSVGPLSRWMALHALERFGAFRPENITTGSLVVGLMEEGIRKLMMTDDVVGDVINAGRARRYVWATSCPTCPGGICDGSCF